MSNSSHGERVVSASQCQSARHSLKKKKKTWLSVLGIQGLASGDRRRKKEQNGKEEEGKCR